MFIYAPVASIFVEGIQMWTAKSFLFHLLVFVMFYKNSRLREYWFLHQVNEYLTLWKNCTCFKKSFHERGGGQVFKIWFCTFSVESTKNWVKINIFQFWFFYWIGNFMNNVHLKNCENSWKNELIVKNWSQWRNFTKNWFYPLVSQPLLWPQKLTFLSSDFFFCWVKYH